jgi:hypothetical protein
MVPITETERRYAHEHGSPALAEKLAAAGHGWIAPVQRKSVV